MKFSRRNLRVVTPIIREGPTDRILSIIHYQLIMTLNPMIFSCNIRENHNRRHKKELRGLSKKVTKLDSLPNRDTCGSNF